MQHHINHLAEQSSSLAAPLASALTIGLDQAADYFADFAWPSAVDPHLFAHLVRRHARTRLSTQSLGSWELREDVAMAAIHFRHRQFGHEVRVLRGGIGSVPPPGRTKARRAFYEQGILPLVDPSSHIGPMNLPAP